MKDQAKEPEVEPELSMVGSVPISEKKRRRRIGHQQIGVPVADPLEYKQNKCTPNARIITTIDEKITINLWYDKHYVNREQHGEDDGEKREGIEAETVEKLVLASIRHLMYYSSCVKGFSFLNHDDPPKGRENRVVIQTNSSIETLNVIIQAHHIDLNEYEVTVKTAKMQNDWRLSVGQYALELFEDDANASILWQEERGIYKEKHRL